MNRNIKSLLKKDYLDSYENMFLNDRLSFLLAVWKDIILPNSNKCPIELKDYQYSALEEALSNLNKNIVDYKKINQCDKLIVSYILKLCIKLNNKNIVDFIFNRTKSSIEVMPEYFYFNELIDSYILLLDIEGAKKVVDKISSSNHISYCYKILNIDCEKYKNYPEFYKHLNNKRYQKLSQILKTGQSINIDLNLEILNGIYQYI